MTNSNTASADLRFETKLTWMEAEKGIITSDAVADTIRVKMPLHADCVYEHWGAVHLLLGAVSTSFMSAYLYLASQLGVVVTHFFCQAVAMVSPETNKYTFTRIELYTKVLVPAETSFEKAHYIMERTKVNCVVANSLNVTVIYHCEVASDPNPRQ
ncbi:Organic hydroperoxide reductase OsmC/OhrA [Chitinophaga jiangningensis]|uniref:Organic hydroperoxide reductase OsmC/OhrA n=1 Tax=Chitinophaga jiangningensis TaxID=1419482 RepID=A0A1M7C2W6_9BACT|nr:OsmC family protein [Chitinophaga jiangningensis]SHL61486.1 Organic hydroperoxide reductase OsmC/OhrA [Chitinophaga jiangningensis]